ANTLQPSRSSRRTIASPTRPRPPVTSARIERSVRRSPLHLGEPLLVALLDRFPVDDVPPGLEVVGPAVAVREVVGVLPDVVSEDREVVVQQRRVLVRRRVEREPG